MAAAVGPAIGVAGNLIGGGKAAKAQKQQADAGAQQQQAVMNMINQYLGQAAPVIQNVVRQLGEWSGLKTPELQNLVATDAAANDSAIKTAESRGAFGANQNAAIGDALERGRLSSEMVASNLGSAAAQQELGALQSIPGSLSALNPTGSGANTLANMGMNNSAAAASAGNPYAPAAQSLGQLAAVGKNKSTGGAPAGGYMPLGSSVGAYTGSALGPPQYTGPFPSSPLPPASGL